MILRAEGLRKLYGEFWAGESALDSELQASLGPRGTEWLFEAFSALGPKPGQLLVDVGARDAVHAIRLESHLPKGSARV